MIAVTGCSDDLIEVEGDIDEEFSPGSGDIAFLGFSSGVLLRVEYTDSGIWRIVPIKGQHLVTVEFAPEDESDGYSDVATLHDGATWVVCGSAYA